MKAQGFTLIEMLIVIAIIGILATIGVGTLLRWRASSAVLDGAQQFAQAVNAVRTGAKKANACWQIRLTSATAATTQYEVKKFPTTDCSGSATSTQTSTLPGGTNISMVTTAGNDTTNEVNFSPPYATTDAVPNTYSVQWAATPSISRTVRITSILGKVVVK